jgi:methylase of polypeptide subunit release factors
VTSIPPKSARSGRHNFVARIEQQRLTLQALLDSEKTQSERNRLGQFSTPTTLAHEILRYAENIFPKSKKVRFFDPAFGTGAFYSAFCSVFPKTRIAQAVGIEIDAHYARPAIKLWQQSGLQLRIADFISHKPEEKFNLIVCNPPYVRHHHLQDGEKQRLRLITQQASGIQLSGLAGLYCHFVGLCHPWMEADAVAGWLIPSQFMDVNYGLGLKEYLLRTVTLLHIHRFDPNDVQFSDALVSSAVVWFRNSAPSKHHRVEFTFGGTLLRPKIRRMVSAKELLNEPKWTRFPVNDVRVSSNQRTLSELFQIKRGLATGDNRYFILPESEIEKRGLPMGVFRPIFPSPRYLVQDEITARPDGTPEIERRLFLLDTRIPEDEIQRRWPKLYEYLEEGKQRKLHLRYLCSHRSPWYAQENRPAPPITCTYLGRSDKKNGRPFRFILNHSSATVANVYLSMYPTPLLQRFLEADPQVMKRMWMALNALPAEQLLGEGRLYGGGLHKLEPKELAKVDATSLFAQLDIAKAAGVHAAQLRMF